MKAECIRLILSLKCDPGLFTQLARIGGLFQAFWRPENAYISIDMTIYGQRTR